jgi:hypothetical protein
LKGYRLKYLPLFEKDVAAARDYIADTLHSPVAARRLVTDVERAILRRKKAPLAFAPYPAKSRHPQTYYYIRLRNYLIFYVVIGDVMEVRRFIHSHRDVNALL